MRNSYRDDCIFLLKDLSNDIKEITIEEKEELIRAGVNYSEMISKEGKPSEEITKIFLNMMERDKSKIALYVAKLSELIYKKKGRNLVLVSLARAGTPYGILIKKYLKEKYDISFHHYSISIIRGKGIDKNALKFILKEHPNANIQFIDGWTGKGSITKELNKSIKEFNENNNSNIDDSLAVISDPAKLCRICGTRKDIGLATCCLNSTVSGLISRTIHNEKYIGEDDFHGAKFLDYLQDEDYSQLFIDKICGEFHRIVDNFQNNELSVDNSENSNKEILNEKVINKEVHTGYEEIDKGYSEKITKEIQDKYNVKNINNIKLSVGESARVLLRRDPRLVLVKDMKDENIEHILQLAKERDVEVIEYKGSDYNCIAIIKEK